MRITIQFFDGCSHWKLADQRLRQAMADLGRTDVEIMHQRVESPDDADRLGFRGSPTFLVNGRDVFVRGEMAINFGCRVYETEEGVQGAPSVAQLRHVLRSAS